MFAKIVNAQSNNESCHVENSDLMLLLQMICDQWDRLGQLSQQRRHQLEEVLPPLPPTLPSPGGTRSRAHRLSLPRVREARGALQQLARRRARGLGGLGDRA